MSYYYVWFGSSDGSIGLVIARARSHFSVAGHMKRIKALIHFLPAAASSMTFATSLGWDNITTWLDGRTVVVAFICFAMLFSCSGAIMLSLLATMYHEGLLCHAAVVGFAPKMEPAVWG